MIALPSKVWFFLLIVVTAVSTLNAQDIAVEDADDNDAKSPKVSELHRSLLGAWVLTGAPGNTNQPKADAEMKFWGLRHFAVTKRNSQTGKIDYHHVGTYTLTGDDYTETITYAVGQTEYLVGRSFKFKIQTDGDTYLQRGVGNPWNQQWKRLVADAPAERNDADR